MVHWISQTKTTRSIHKHPLIRTQSASHKLYRHWKLHIQARRTHSSFKAKHLNTKPNCLSLLTVVHRSITPVHSYVTCPSIKIYTHTKFQLHLQFINKVKGASLLQPLPINHLKSCLTWYYNHTTKRLTPFITITDRSQQVSTMRNFTKLRICTHNLLARVTFHHKASKYQSIATRLAYGNIAITRITITDRSRQVLPYLTLPSLEYTCTTFWPPVTNHYMASNY